MINYLEVYNDYLLFERNLSPKTIETYREQIYKFLQYLREEQLSIKTINAENIRSYLQYCRDIGNSDRTLCLIITVLKSFYRFLNKDHITDNNPTLVLQQIKLQKGLPETLTLEEVERILSVIGDNSAQKQRDKTLIEFLFTTGARISETTNLLLNQLNFDEGTCILHGKGSKDRMAFLGDVCLSYLAKYLMESRKELLKDRQSNYVFVGKKAEKLDRSYVLTLVKKYAKMANVKKNISPHTFRHSFATSLIENDADLVTVKTLLGHSNIATTQIYTHISKQRLKDVYNKAHPFGKKEENSNEI